LLQSRCFLTPFPFVSEDAHLAKIQIVVTWTGFT